MKKDKAAIWVHLTRQKRGHVAILWLTSLVIVAVFADFFAGSLPIYARVQNETIVFANVTKPASLSRAAVYSARQEKGGIYPLVPYSPNEQSADLFAAPSTKHPFGTDSLGRDVFARIVFGTRTVVLFGVLAVLGVVAIGVFFGGVAGFFGGWVDVLLARVIETMQAFPGVLLVLAVQALVSSPSAFSLLFAIALTRWSEVARLVRMGVTRTIHQDYVVAARALGATAPQVFLGHVWPNVRGDTLVAGALALSSIFLIEASCDFLGFGLGGNTVTWGSLLGEVRFDVHAWWILAFPGLALSVTVMAQNIVGETLRDHFDPRSAS